MCVWAADRIVDSKDGRLHVASAKTNLSQQAPQQYEHDQTCSIHGSVYCTAHVIVHSLLPQCLPTSMYLGSVKFFLFSLFCLYDGLNIYNYRNISGNSLYLPYCVIFNPWRICAASVTVVALCVC